MRFSANPRFDNDKTGGTATVQRIDILLIDDNSDDAELTMCALHRLGLDRCTRWAADGVQALDWLLPADPAAALLPRLILLDLRMPRVDGYEVLRQIKQSDCTRNVPVLVMAGSARSPELPRCFALGAAGSIVKPLRIEAFITASRSAGVQWPRVRTGTSGAAPCQMHASGENR